MWEAVQTLLLPAMFRLAHTMPLASVLGDHELVHFISHQHKVQRELLLQRDRRKEAQMIGGDDSLQPATPDVGRKGKRPKRMRRT